MRISRRSFLAGAGAVALTSPARAFVIPRNTLVFPGGLPGFARGHLAAVGLTPRNGLSAIAVNGGADMVNLLSGARATVTGTMTASNFGAIGPVMGTTANANYATFASISATAPTQVTYAGIVVFSSILNSIQVIMSGSVFPGTSAALTGSANLGAYINGTGEVNSGIVPVANTPYFFIVSIINSVSLKALLLNLNNGKVQTASVSTAGTIGSQSQFVVGNWSGGGSNMNGSVAAVMMTPRALSIPAMLQWAANPWEFWYPSAAENLIFESVSANGAAPPITLFPQLPMMGVE